jgi:tetratricopeptide (TPR) repeat protein
MPGRFQNECMEYARAAIEKYPDDSLHFRRWEALAKIRSGQVQDGLSQLEDANVRFGKQWYIQCDIANAYVRLGRFDVAWLWYCRAALLPGDIKGRIVMLRSMCDLLQRLERWQAVYEHLRLVLAIEDAYNSQQYAERTLQRISEFRKRHAEHLHVSTKEGNSVPSISITLKPCRFTWQQAIRISGTIQYLNIENRYGFIINGGDRYHFNFDAFTSRDKLEVGKEVEFEPQDAFDRKRNQPGKIASHVRVVK